MDTHPGQEPVPDNVDLFDAYFKRADLNGDGWISGDEAVSFFRGSNLDKTVLYQVSTLIHHVHDHGSETRAPEYCCYRYT